MGYIIPADIVKRNNFDYVKWLFYEAIELKEKYGKYRVLWAIEQMEKKYECKAKS